MFSRLLSPLRLGPVEIPNRIVSSAHQTTLQHHALAGASGGEVELSNVFAPELLLHIAADLLVLAQGRIPDDALAPQLVEAGLQVEEAGDCLSPRSLEEAILEGTLAARRACAFA